MKTALDRIRNSQASVSFSFFCLGQLSAPGQNSVLRSLRNIFSLDGAGKLQDQKECCIFASQENGESF